MVADKRKSQDGEPDYDTRLRPQGGSGASSLAESKAMLQSRLDDAEQNRDLKEKYAYRAWWYLVAYSVFAGGVVVFQGFGFCEFELPVFALTTLVGSTAVAAIGLMYVTLRGLFGTRSGNDDQ